jgi:hypothetical protein
MDFEITRGIPVLERTPGALHAMLHDLGAAWIDPTEGLKTWGAYVIVGHLAAWRLTDTELALAGEHPSA